MSENRVEDICMPGQVGGKQRSLLLHCPPEALDSDLFVMCYSVLLPLEIKTQAPVIQRAELKNLSGPAEDHENVLQLREVLPNPRIGRY